MYKAIAILVLPLSLIACDRLNTAQLAESGAAPASVRSRAPSEPDFPALVKKAGPAVVNVSSTLTLRRPPLVLPPDLPEDDPLYEFFRRFSPPPGGPRGLEAQTLGSGFIISDDGYILTNAHIIQDAKEVRVRLTDKREFQARLIGVDRRTDVGLIKIDGKGLPRVEIGDPARLEVGEWVAAIGSPFGFENSVTKGIVSAKGRSLPDEDYVPFIQTDAAINPGSSGGPLFNMAGQVVGINSQILSGTGGFMGISFAIPIDVAMNVAEQLRTHGKVVRGMLGVTVVDVVPEVAKSLRLGKETGALIVSVKKGSPADKSGLAPGDVVLKYQDKPVEKASDLVRMVAETRPGTQVKLEVWRRGEAKQASVLVGELPAERAVQKSALS